MEEISIEQRFKTEIAPLVPQINASMVDIFRFLNLYGNPIIAFKDFWKL